jgi:carbon-monoxide dehydrogenase large subunit
MTGSGIGAAVRRKEDFRFLTGQGTYTDDINRPGQLHAWMLRSPHAHARIAGIDTTAAAAAPGVVAIFTGKDLTADGIGGLPCGWGIHSKDGSPMAEPPHPALAVDKVRHVGDQVAVVIAESKQAARDAAELIAVDYQVLPAAATLEAALRPGAPQIFDGAPGNLCYDWQIGDKDAVAAAFVMAAHVAKLEIVNNRLIPNAMEPRAAIGEFDRATGEYTLYTTTQNPHVIRLLMGAFVLHIPEHKLRVVAPDVGGGFGSKIFHYAEEAILTWAAGKVRRPIKWTAERSESFMSDAHGRDHGGLAQGIGQALLEGCVYDSDGQLLTGSYNDYCMPRAGDVPSFAVSTNTTLCTHNPLGVKGCGEAGAIGAPAAVMNAIVDALAPLGIRHVDMPATPERLWRAIQSHDLPQAAE